jgi:hypothetical protein
MDLPSSEIMILPRPATAPCITQRKRAVATGQIASPEHVLEKLHDFSDQNMLQPFDFEHLLFTRVIQPERKMLLVPQDFGAVARISASISSREESVAPS